MIVNLSEQAGDAMLNGLGKLMDGGSVELLSEDARVLAVLPLSTPAAKFASSGEIELNRIGEADATTSGTATTARIVGPGGTEILSCDVGSAESDAVIRLTPTRIEQGSPVRLNSFRLSMP